MEALLHCIFIVLIDLTNERHLPVAEPNKSATHCVRFESSTLLTNFGFSLTTLNTKFKFLLNYKSHSSHSHPHPLLLHKYAAKAHAGHNCLQSRPSRFIQCRRHVKRIAAIASICSAASALLFLLPSSSFASLILFLFLFNL